MMIKIFLTICLFQISSFANNSKVESSTRAYLKINSDIPNFSSKNLNGSGRVSTSLLADSNLNIVVDFAASWCLPCLESIPVLVEKVKGLEETRLIIIMTDKKWGEKQEEFIQKAGLKGSGIRVVWDKYGALKSRYKLGQALPVSYFFNQSKLVAFHEGVVDQNFLEQLF